MRRFSYKKSVQALNLIAVWGGGSMNKMKAIKTMWLADRYHLRKYGRPIFNDLYTAMENGPVLSATRDILQRNSLGVSQEILDYSEQFLSSNQYNYKSVNTPAKQVFSDSDLEALEIIFKTYGSLGHYPLRDLSHDFPEWQRWEDGLKKKLYKSHEMDYNDFFKSPQGDHQLFVADDDLETVHKLFKKEE